MEVLCVLCLLSVALLDNIVKKLKNPNTRVTRDCTVNMAGRRGGLRATRRHGSDPNSTSSALRSDSSATVVPHAGTETQVHGSPSNRRTRSSRVRGQTSARASRVRGQTSGLGARQALKHAKNRFNVQFRFGARAAVCANTSKFNNEIGKILRTDCSLHYDEWRDVPESVRAPLREKLLTLFDIDVEDQNVIHVINRQMQRSWRSYRYTLHKKFKEIGGDEDPIKAKSIGHKGVKKEDWDYLCDLWASESYKERAKKNAISRSKRKWESRNGSKSTLRHHIERGVELDAPTGQIETWRICNWQSDKGWSSPELEAKYEDMMQLRRDNPPDEMTDKEIIEKVLGRQSVRLNGWGRSPSKSRGECSQGSIRPSYEQLRDELDENREHVKTLEDRIRMLEERLENNSAHNSSIRRAPSDHASAPSNMNASPASDDGYDSDDIC
ncbi:uncharacterized protein LOC130992830 isoform X3 [Salvia miltiorrhiza]|uniref:uncharacterized protein LOC130991398 isoform X3 n=2 Tax=Salvia miltiorrhiza TaxID=226208 RepID=UPI0025AC4E72|nr:uncharacterized protein LOC130991398 isoform X3 [Salvia miltiorrhiza]XP_057773564.1 uncharacterized protein LOC130992830 isoform X3 [Salvia miltiorrhiza]